MNGKLVLYGVLGVLGLYLVSWAVTTLLFFHYERQAIGAQRRAAELGEKHAPLPGPAMQPLKDACAGKLTGGDVAAIVGYVAAMAPSRRPVLEKDYYHVDQTLLGTQEVFRRTLTARHMKDLRDGSLEGAITEMVNPADWSLRLQQAYRGFPEMRGTKYLVAARYESLTLPGVKAEGYESGRGAFGARVLAFPSGEVVCEGRGTVRMKERGTGSGRGKTKESAQLEAASSARGLVQFVFTQAVVTTPLHEVCEAGGKTLCDLTAENVGASPR